MFQKQVLIACLEVCKETGTKKIFHLQRRLKTCPLVRDICASHSVPPDGVVGLLLLEPAAKVHTIGLVCPPVNERSFSSSMTSHVRVKVPMIATSGPFCKADGLVSPWRRAIPGLPPTTSNLEVIKMAGANPTETIKAGCSVGVELAVCILYAVSVQNIAGRPSFTCTRNVSMTCLMLSPPPSSSYSHVIANNTITTERIAQDVNLSIEVEY